MSRSPYPYLGLSEMTAAKLAVLFGHWPEWFVARLKRVGCASAPEHVKAEVAAMKKRKEAGDPEWRRGSERSPELRKRS